VADTVDPKRAASLIEEAFDENVKGLSIAKWAQVSGGQSIDAAMTGFGPALTKIKELRDRQLAEVPKVFP
jgi:hypothetical protein